MSDEKEDLNIASPPPSKKLKQARLPFKLLTPKSDSPPNISPSNQKKRKLSDTISGPQKAAKSAKNDENSFQNKKSLSLDTENEVSSSSESKISQPNPPSLDAKQKVIGLLDKFVRSTQQREVSTSSEHEPVDLTLSDNEAEGKEVGLCQSIRPELASHVSPARSRKDNTLAECAVQFTDHPPPDTASVKSPNAGFRLNVSSPGNDKAAIPEDMKVDHTSSDEISSARQTTPEDMKVDHTSSDEISSARQTTPTPNMTVKSSKKDKDKLEKQRLKEEVKAEREKQRKDEKEKKELERLEAKKKREEEKQHLLDLKQKDREEKQRIKEEEKKKRQQEKDEERKKKQQEKDEEKRKKQDLIDAKNEDKRKKEEEKVKAEEDEKAKKEKVKARFSRYFTKSDKQGVQGKLVTESRGPFIAFEVKKDMRVAPLIRVQRDILHQKMNNLDKHLEKQISSPILYLDELQGQKYFPGKSQRTWSHEQDTDVEILETTRQALDTKKAKLLQFCENHRPAYYGTWRKQSQVVHARCPFAKDQDMLDYDVDSDDEWEEEEPGESLSNSEGEDSDDDKEAADEDEDGFFVPHGYLSEGEGCEDDDDDVSPESLKAKQLARAKAWDAQMKGRKNCEVLKPVCIGLYWSEAELEVERDPTWEKLQEYTAIPLTPQPISVEPDSSTEDNSPNIEGPEKKKKKEHTNFMPVPEEAIPDLLRLVHGNIFGIQKLVKEFQVYWHKKTTCVDSSDPVEGTGPTKCTTAVTSSLEPSQSEDMKDNNSQDLKYSISKRQLETKIRGLAVYEKRESFRKTCWYVHQDILDEYKMTDLLIPTSWHWLTRTNKPQKEESKSNETCSLNVSNSKKAHPPVPNIKQFTVPGYTPQMATSSPGSKICEEKTSLSDVCCTTPKQSVKHSNSSETPKLICDGMTPSPLLKQNVKSQLQVTEQSKGTPVKATPMKGRNQRTLMSMFSPPHSNKQRVSSHEHENSDSVLEGIKPGDTPELPMEID